MYSWLKHNPITMNRSQQVYTYVHRLANLELKAIYIASKESIREELITLLLFTTGLMVGGLSNPEASNVCKMIIKDKVIN